MNIFNNLVVTLVLASVSLFSPLSLAANNFYEVNCQYTHGPHSPGMLLDVEVSDGDLVEWVFKVPTSGVSHASKAGNLNVFTLGGSESLKLMVNGEAKAKFEYDTDSVNAVENKMTTVGLPLTSLNVFGLNVYLDKNDQQISFEMTDEITEAKKGYALVEIEVDEGAYGAYKMACKSSMKTESSGVGTK